MTSHTFYLGTCLSSCHEPPPSIALGPHGWHLPPLTSSLIFGNPPRLSVVPVEQTAAGTSHPSSRPASSPHTNLSAQDRDGCTPGKGLLPKGSLVTQAMCHIRSGRVGVVTGTALAVKMLSLPRAFYANVNCVFLSFPSLNSLCYLSDIYFCFSQTRLLSVFQTCVSPSLASFPPIFMPGVRGPFGKIML